MSFEDCLIYMCSVTREQVIRASGIRHRMRPTIGALAVQQQLLDRSEVELVLATQRGGPLRFGEVAVSLGLLSSATVEDLLGLQRDRTPTAGDALLSMGVVDEHLYHWVLGWYEQQCAEALDVETLETEQRPDATRESSPVGPPETSDIDFASAA